jgi:radical SAM superfamily enzyme YgiQ (UPF0313 family)
VSSKPLLIYFADLTYDTVTISTESFPLNIGYISSYSKKLFGDKIEIKLFKYIEKLEAAIFENPPDVLALSNYVWCHRISLEMFRILKQKNPLSLTVWGGPNFPVELNKQNSFMKKNLDVDIYVPDEGEIGFSKIISLALLNNSKNTMRQNVLKNPIDGCVVRTTDGKIQYSLSLDRLKNLDEIPSPYTNHMFDEFFDGKLSPMLQTNRGCPFSCTFCVDGSDSVNQVNKFSMNRVYEEIQYISKHSQNNSSLIITDLNFGMIPRDNEICDYLDESQKNYNYPKQIQVTTGKNSKDKIINAIKKLKESVRFYMSVQSLDQEVLTNIKRDNISVDQMLALGPSIKDAGLQTVSEVILGLPGESTESHIETLRKLVKARISDIQVFQCMMLDGSELNTTEQREKWDLKTKYRILPRDFAKLQNGKNIVEIEEIVISSNKMTFDEYLELRLLAFSLWVTNKGVVYDPILKFLHEKGIDVFNLFYTMAQNRNQLHPEIQNIFKLVNNATKDELWDSPEEIESSYQDDSNYNKLLSGESGMNIMFYFQAVVTATALEAWTNSVLENSKKLLIEQNKFDDQTSKEFLEISNFCIGISNNPLGDNRMKTNYQFNFKYDIQKWVNDTSDLTLKDFQFKSSQNISFELTLEQFEFVEEKIQIFGKTMNGLSQCLKRIPTKTLWRIPVNKTKSLLN